MTRKANLSRSVPAAPLVARLEAARMQLCLNDTTFSTRYLSNPHAMRRLRRRRHLPGAKAAQLQALLNSFGTIQPVDSDPLSPAQYLAPLEAARAAMNVTPSAFGRSYFHDGGFLSRLDKVSKLHPETVGRIRDFLAQFAAGEIKALRPRRQAGLPAEPYVTRLEEACAALAMRPCVFSARFFGYRYKVPSLKTRASLRPETVAQIEDFLAKFDRGEFDHMKPERRP